MWLERLTNVSRAVGSSIKIYMSVCLPACLSVCLSNFHKSRLLHTCFQPMKQISPCCFKSLRLMNPSHQFYNKIHTSIVNTRINEESLHQHVFVVVIDFRQTRGNLINVTCSIIHRRNYMYVKLKETCRKQQYLINKFVASAETVLLCSEVWTYLQISFICFLHI